LVPVEILDRSRFFTMLPSAAALLVMIPLVVAAPIAVAHRLAGGAAVLLIVTIVVVSYRRQRALPGDVLVVPLLAALAGSSLLDPKAVMGITYGVLIGLSLYGTLIRAAALTGGMMGAILIALAWNPSTTGSGVPWDDPAVFTALPQLAMLSALTRILYGSLVSHQRTSRQQAILAESGGRLLSARDAAELRQVAADTTRALGRLTPDLAGVFVHSDGTALTITATMAVPDQAAQRQLPMNVLEFFDHANPHVAQPVCRGRDALTRLAPDARHWEITALGPADDRRYAIVGSRRPIRADDFTAFRTLGQQLAMAHANCESRELLYHQAHHDQLTGLPMRQMFLKTLTAAIESPSPGVVLLYIDLDDFKPVNDRYGHAAGDQLLTAVAGRLTDAAGPGGLAARFGGDEFAVLLTGVATETDARENAERISRRLLEPVHLTAGTLTIGASIGLAQWEPLVTVEELLHRADAAMYAAKVAGQSRIVVFTQDDGPQVERTQTAQPQIAL
jgi:diguanylate cyclase (GGDEF)-like protein